VATAGHGRRPAPGAQLANLGECAELAAGTAVELIDIAIERRLADEWDDQDVGRNVPWLIGDDTKLHGGRDPPRGCAVRLRSPDRGGSW